MKVLHVIRDLSYHGTARQLRLVARRLADLGIESLVIVFKGPTPWTRELCTLGIDVQTLGWSRPFDLAPWGRLWKWYRRFQPDIVHAWGMTALRGCSCLTILGGARTGSTSLRACGGVPTSGGHPTALVASHIVPRWQSQRPANWLDRWHLSRINRVVIESRRDEEWCRSHGVLNPAIIEAGVAAPELTARAHLPVPDNARIIVCTGQLERDRGIRDAIWALDILKYLYDDLHLVIIGEGPERDSLERFAGAIDALDRVHLIGAVSNVGAILERALIAWVPGAGGGTNATLEAMAAGLPVVATKTGNLSELIIDDETGFLVEHEDRPALARQTRLLLDDAALRMRLGGAGRRRTIELSSIGTVANKYANLYREITEAGADRIETPTVSQPP
jgi:glycosyltransferase involved in cell wall biosynthesis